MPISDGKFKKGLPFKISFFMWRLWFRRTHIREVLIRRRIVDHLRNAAGLNFPIVPLSQIIQDWWKDDGVPKVMPRFKAIPAFII
ncbi:hypothetical protein H5410_036569 [Solanum commersonii]|uniref:Uncharacterized protein n=1 Tax=Solanum commersonii TaxID=4109 RepID=A0A9J5Y4M7_SOLCO|nr:hypothetical protein H5410_036569 [Solanum commersonii]